MTSSINIQSSRESNSRSRNIPFRYRSNGGHNKENNEPKNGKSKHTNTELNFYMHASRNKVATLKNFKML